MHFMFDISSVSFLHFSDFIIYSGFASGRERSLSRVCASRVPGASWVGSAIASRQLLVFGIFWTSGLIILAALEWTGICDLVSLFSLEEMFPWSMCGFDGMS